MASDFLTMNVTNCTNQEEKCTKNLRAYAARFTLLYF